MIDLTGILMALSIAIAVTIILEIIFYRKLRPFRENTVGAHPNSSALRVILILQLGCPFLVAIFVALDPAVNSGADMFAPSLLFCIYCFLTEFIFMPVGILALVSSKLELRRRK
ncbi:hypothetical protein OAF27_02030 [Verrucomicrobiales bacterium]|nr:hypothetical protein [Verrucomicrobiales bacterium]